MLIAPLVTTPYVSRVLGVTNIGIYNYAQSIATYFVLIGAVGTTIYGQREIAYCQDDPEKRTRAFWEIEIFRIVASVICTGVYFVVFCNFGTYVDIYKILVIEVAATAFDISWFFMGMENFKLTVIRNTIIKLAGVVCIFLFVKTKDDLGIYTICMTAPIFIGNISLWFAIKKYTVKINFSFRETVKGIKKRCSPIFVLFVPQLAIEVYTVLDKTMIGMLASDIDQVGYYSQAQKIVKIVLVLGTSLGTVMLPKMAASFARGDTKGIISSIKNAFRFTYLLGFALMFGVCAIAPRFVPIFFGSGYDQVSMLMIVISPILVIIPIANVLGKQYLIPTNQQKPYTISVFIGAGTNVLLNLLLIRYFNAIGASIATVIAELTVATVQCIFVRGQLPLKKCLTSGFRYLVFGAVMYLVLLGLDFILPAGKVWAIIVMVVVGALVYFSELLLVKDPMIRLGIDLLKRRDSKKQEKC